MWVITMEQQNGNNMTNNVIDANFNIISHFLSSALRNVEFSDIIRSEGRTVFVSMAKETKQIVIPEKKYPYYRMETSLASCIRELFKSFR